ncbi:DUF945 family protein [Oceanospirillum linum]|uniref:DUF945 domain-containing protein n=1 Tax=Oceanospirillum linum TaxID=966 RepID=A0A1T1HAM2_OCELI|nr:DUF945 family protein [Oceanospirillum linum]OOV86826.1 hypothetical protein BTA35_0211035 [Oceanospirillum linum]SEG21348.1 Uncharacterized conserved protein YdgA, DUF945 family [Oleiphilus messinensis]SMP24987.1 Uncharacterized conserved protein YdgA, DUF945 family [Oceanospirillum linum]
MNKITAGILIGAGAVGAATAAYIPVKVGDTVQQQITLAVASANAQQGSSGLEIQVIDYRKNAYDSSLITRILLNEPSVIQADGTAPYIDISHQISHGFTGAEFISEVVVTEEMKESLKDFDDKVPLHFDGEISADKSVLNTYIEGFTLTPDNGVIKMKPGIIRLNYDAGDATYDLNGIWNGLELNAEGNQLTVGETSIKGSGQQQTEFIWSYSNDINVSHLGLSNDRIEIQSASLNLNDKLNIQKQQAADETIHYSGNWSLDKLHIAQFGQTLYDFEPSGFSYTLSGPTVKQTEALMKVAQEMDSEQMTPQDAQEILPIFADVVNAATFSLHDVNVVTTEGRINGDMNLSLDTSQQELIKALSFPPILAQYVKLESNASVNKSLFNSMPVFSMMAMQLNQMGAYQEDEEDMLIHARMENGQLTINDVLMR